MFQQNPFIIQVNDEDGKGVKFKGYCIDLIEEIRKLIGFEYEIYIAPDNNFGKIRDFNVTILHMGIILNHVLIFVFQATWTKTVNGTE